MLACFSGSDEVLPVAATESLRDTAQGQVVGFESPDGAHVWRGIPFAKPPVGALRWKAPRPPEAREGVLSALEYGHSCAQFSGPGGGRKGQKAGEMMGSEDCLYLNVHTPRFARNSIPQGDARLPVMLWIHGGGNTIGDALFYDAGVLATSQQLVVVTVHYRLGAFGWFSHPALRDSEATADDNSGNYGTLDLVRALAWLQENIASFGGNPSRVTVFGESAGGSNTFSMLLTPRAAGLFSGAIVQSGGTRTTELSSAENYTDDPEPGHEFSSGETILRLLVGDGKAADRAAAKQQVETMDDATLSAYLRGKSASELLNAYDGSDLGGMYSVPRQIRDGHVLPLGEPVAAFRSGHYNRVPTVLGTNRDENKLFMLLGSEYVTRVAMLPLWLNDANAYHASAEYSSLMWRSRGVDDPATAMYASQGPSVFAYRFDWDDERKLLWLDLGELLGAAHGLEIPFVFGRLELGLATSLVFDDNRKQSDRRLSDAMMSYWSQFAYTGSPGRGRDGELPRWTSWGEEGAETFLALDSEHGGGIRMSSDAVSRPELIARVATDARLPELQQRCALYDGFVQWGDGMSEGEYAQVEDGACLAALPHVAAGSE